MISQLMLPGYCQIPLYQSDSGPESRFHPDTIVWMICGYTVVDSDNYHWLNQYRWLRAWNPNARSYYVYRTEKFQNGKNVKVYMAREVLGLPWVKGKGGDEADHINHDTVKNTRDNLRRVTRSQNQVNKRKYGVKCRFKCVTQHGSGFYACVKYHRRRTLFSTVKTEVEAALMYNYAIYLLQGEFAHLNEIPEDEMPSYERQVELYDMVVKKLTKVGLLVCV